MSGQNLLISGDAPGTVSACLEQKLNATVLFVNGAAAIWRLYIVVIGGSVR
jgi:hypothetical protein